MFLLSHADDMDVLLYAYEISRSSLLTDNPYYVGTVMPGVSGLYRHIMLTQQDNIKILWIDFLKLFCIEHPHPPLQKTMKPMPAPEYQTPLLWSFP